ncbi:MAG TPA: hypothetical protein VNL91_07775 [Thermoanaerobaculia bacterium]|nr:hypothetical protein [Thermoanaerobaculia bacterium]
MKRAAALLILLIAIPAPAAERWWDHYKKGIAAINAKNWEAAADSLRRSLAEMPNESTSARTRKEIIVYVPHFYLGIARFNLGDVDGALAEWKISEEQGAIQNTDYYASLKEWVNRARAEKQKSARDASAESRNAADAMINSALSAQTAAVAAGGDRSDNYLAAERKINEAMSLFRKGGTDVAAYRRAAQTAQQARDLFAAAAEEARKAKASRAAVASRQPAPQQEKPAVAEPPRQVAQQPPPQPQQVPAQAPPPQPQAVTSVEVVVADAKPKQEAAADVESEESVTVRIALQKCKARLAQASNHTFGDNEYRNDLVRATRMANQIEQELRSKPDRETVREIGRRVASLEEELDAMMRRAAAKAAGADPRGQLVHAYRAYASGDFTLAETILTRLIESRPTGEAYLLRGCSRYTRAMLSRNRDPLVSQAASDFRSALKLNRRLRLDGKAFSPKIVEFFEQVRKNS